MQPIDIQKLEANGLYWARRASPAGSRLQAQDETEIVQVSTVFGAAFEFWTVAIMGSDQHFPLEDFEFLRKIKPFTPVADVTVSRPRSQNFTVNP